MEAKAKGRPPDRPHKSWEVGIKEQKQVRALVQRTMKDEAAKWFCILNSFIAAGAVSAGCIRVAKSSADGRQETKLFAETLGNSHLRNTGEAGARLSLKQQVGKALKVKM